MSHRVTLLTDRPHNSGLSLSQRIFQAFLGIAIWNAALPASAAGNLREQDIIEFVRNEAVVRLQVPKRDVQVEWAGVALDSLLPTLPPGRVTLQVASTARLAGRANVPLQILINGQKYRTIFPSLDIKVFMQVLVAKTRIARGSIPSEREIASNRVPLGNQAQPPLTAMEQVVGSEATRDIPANTVLVANMFKLATLVKSGDAVSVVATSGGITIIIKGQARSAGAKGQLIKVLNLDSGNEFVARVVGPNRVEVHMEE